MMQISDVLANGKLPAGTARNRAVLAWRRINHKPTSVVFTTPTGTKLAAQTVRLEYDGSSTEATNDVGTAPTTSLIIFGVSGHPSAANTIIDYGYSFVHDTRRYHVVDIIRTLGEIQARAEARG